MQKKIKNLFCFTACEPGFISNNGSCYKFSTDSKNWDTARATCQQAGGDLAIIDTASEAARVKQLRLTTGKFTSLYFMFYICFILMSKNW